MNFLHQLMLPQFFNASLETLFNYLLKRTKYSNTYLRKLNGKVLKTTIQPFDLPIYFVFSSQRVDLLNQYDGEADCIIDIKAKLLLEIPTKQQLSTYINDRSVQLQGDLQVLQDFTAFLEFLEKDPAELLSPFFGDVISQSAVNFLRYFSQMIKVKLQHSQQYWGERLTEEWGIISPSLAVADFCEQVKILEKHTALLEQKFTKSEAKRS